MHCCSKGLRDKKLNAILMVHNPCTWHAHSMLEVEVSMLEVEVSMLEVVGWEDLPFANWCGLRSYDSKS